MPALFAIAAAIDLCRRRIVRAAAWAVAGWMVLDNPLFDQFVIIGHTPAYWPLIALFALACAGGSHRTAAVVLGLLLAARTPMIALVPVFFLHVWRTNPSRLRPTAALFVLTVLASFAPFLIWDWRVLVYGMYGNYVRVVTDFVWTKTPWMSSTLGLTRLLVASGHASWVGAAHVAALLAAWSLAWWRLRAGRSAGPWLVVALATFCLTTLWPVWYIFLDVFVLTASCLLADQVAALRRHPLRATFATSGLTAAVMALTLVFVFPGGYYTLEAGNVPRWYLRSGFGADENDGTHSFAWATRQTVHLRLPRGLRTRAEIRIECEPFEMVGAGHQTMTVQLNGVPIGGVELGPGWQTATFHTRARAWTIGHNAVTLTFAYVGQHNGEGRAVRVSHISIAPEGSDRSW